ncbi:MAG TPA: type VII secretion protein EsaA [Bacillus bacterium]|uniref:ESX secretion system protein YueB n=1 Tax=Siminovitchia fordii TaxID=254759 RepID=A0ABQ4K693_9BACI|nr:type VII secretion protein EsaA [Siminovitchia fordii]GIN20540.1 ESX secretion system protein YueB [Siminovitchia fordii]HBZ09717.1 type VII secretion protein EsaA [Bacillus sp. (in: firmicutes)]
MRSKKSSVISLLIAILIIAAIPLGFFNYIGPEPMFSPKNTTGQIAIVNEDDGFLRAKDDLTTLGKDLILTIEGGESEYEWPVVSRTVAQSGLENKKYDAAIYIPSSFSRDIMSFKEEVPRITNIRFELSPHLNAKNQERVQKELEAAQQKLNGQVTAMYWRYVSEEINEIQTNFGEILDKEIDFLNEMYSFYAPSSQELEKEIDRQRERLTQLFSYSKEATGIAGNSQSSLTEAEKAFETLTNNIDMYLDYQSDVADSLQLIDLENEQLMNEASAEFNVLLEDGERRIREGQEPFQPQLKNEGNNVYDYLQLIHAGAGTFYQQMQGFETNMNTSFQALNQEIDLLPQSHRDVIRNYNQQDALNAFLYTIESTLVKRKDLTQETPDELQRPGAPQDELKGLKPSTLEEVEKQIETIKELLTKLEPEKEKPEPNPIPDPEPDTKPGSPGEPDNDLEQENTMGESEEQPEPTTDAEPESPGESDSDLGQEDTLGKSEDNDLDNSEEQPEQPGQPQQPDTPQDERSPYSIWEEATALIEQLENELNSQKINIKNNGDLISSYIDYLEKLQRYLDQLEERTEALPNSLIDKIQEREKRILSSEPASEFASRFSEPIQNRDPGLLMDYYGLLSELELTMRNYSFSSTLNREHADAAIKQFARMGELREQILESQENVTSFMFLTEDIKQFQKFSTDARTEMDTLLEDTNTVLADLSAEIKEEQQLILSLVNETHVHAGNALEQVKSNRKPIDIEAGPIEGLDGHLVQMSHQASLMEVEQLGDVVSSLSKHQDDLIGSTEEMFGQVSSVQSKSDDLNNRWKKSVDTTKLVHDNMNDILHNAINDGYYNDYVYKHLSNPVNIAGEQVVKPAEPFTPPVVMLVVILLVSLLIGYLAHHYGNLPIPVHLSLYVILSVALGLIISIYGLNIYKMSEAQAIQWSIITVLLVLATSGLMCLILMIGPWIGALGSVLIIFLFTTPLLDMAMPNFSSNNPIAELFISIQHQEQTLFVPGATVLVAITCFSIAIIVAKHIYKNQQLRHSTEEEEYEV